MFGYPESFSVSGGFLTRFASGMTGKFAVSEVLSPLHASGIDDIADFTQQF
jgi:hypothetical protein